MKVLIVDDNADDRRLLRYNLERHGCEMVIEARDGQEGLDLARAHRPDLIISDALMPRLDGFQFLRLIKTDEGLKAIPFVFHSAVYTGSEDAELALHLGAEAFIPKPKEPETLWAEIAAIMGNLKAGKTEAPSPEPVEEEQEYLRTYSGIVAAKLEAKVRELEESLVQRSRVEEALRESEEKYRAIFQNSPLGIFRSTFEGRFLEVNPALATMLGYDSPEAVMREIRDLAQQIYVRAEDRQKIVSEHQRLAGAAQYLNRYRRKDGSEFIANLYLRTLHDADGRPLILEGIVEDITERRNSERERERLLSQMRAVVDNIDTGLIISDTKGRVLEMNPAARALCGYTSRMQTRRHPKTSRSLFELSTLDGGRLALSEWPHDRAVRGETFSGWELRVRRKATGEERIFSFGGTPVHDPDGQVVITVVTLRDVTERWKAQEELERKVRERTRELDRLNRTLKAMLDCNQAIIRAESEQELLQEFCRISMDVEGIDRAWVGLAEQNGARIVRVAASAGFNSRELDDTPIRWADDDRGQGPAGLAIRTERICIQPDLLANPDSFVRSKGNLNLGSRTTIALPLRSGSLVFGALVLDTTRPEFFDERQVQMLQELANDLSMGITSLRTRQERDRALRIAESRAEQLRGMSLELAQTEQRERLRLAQIFHDNLQQLLVGATFDVEALKSQTRSETARKTIKRLSETLTEALNVSRATTTELCPPVFYEKGLLAGLEWLGSQMQKKHGLKVGIEVVGNVEPEAERIRMFLLEAVRELLLNVVKHAMVDHARVRVRPLGTDAIAVTVADTGIGFDQARRENGEPSSHGFGLFSIREKLKYLQGRMKIESTPERGSRITLVVPSGGWPASGNGKSG